MSDAPPPYEDTTKAKKVESTRPGTHAASTHLDVPRNGIPALHRRSMEDEGRPLPAGWIRQYDAKDSHQFFVDTNANPPRSIWQHPYDDEQYLSTLSSEERETLEANATKASRASRLAESSADESDIETPHKPGNPEQKLSTGTADLPQRPHSQKDENLSGLGKFGRRMKDKLTSSTHEERIRERQRLEQEELALYQRHQHIRAAMTRAEQTGQPQLLGKNADGRDVYLEPPPYGRQGYQGGYGGMPVGSYHTYDPYTQGPYSNSNNRFVAYPRPVDAYGRPYYPGYGPRYGAPLAGGLLGDCCWAGFCSRTGW